MIHPPLWQPSIFSLIFRPNLNSVNICIRLEGCQVTSFMLKIDSPSQVNFPQLISIIKIFFYITSPLTSTVIKFHPISPHLHYCKFHIQSAQCTSTLVNFHPQVFDDLVDFGHLHAMKAHDGSAGWTWETHRPITPAWPFLVSNAYLSRATRYFWRSLFAISVV